METPAGTPLPDEEQDDAHNDEESHDDGDADEVGAVAEVDWLVAIEMNEFSYDCVLPRLEVGTGVAMRSDFTVT